MSRQSGAAGEGAGGCSRRQPWVVVGRREQPETHGRTSVVERVRTHTGQEIDYAFLASPDGVLVVPVTDDGRIVLLHQYRHPVRAWRLEVPAGTLNRAGESPEAAARRELEDEIGARAARLELVGTILGSVAQLTVRNHVVLATGVHLGPSHREPTELVEAVPRPIAEVYAQLRRGEIVESQTMPHCSSASPSSGPPSSVGRATPSRRRRRETQVRRRPGGQGLAARNTATPGRPGASS